MLTAEKVTARLVESNVSILPGLLLVSSAGRLPRQPDQCQPNAHIEYGTAFTTSYFNISAVKIMITRVTNIRLLKQ